MLRQLANLRHVPAIWISKLSHVVGTFCAVPLCRARSRIVRAASGNGPHAHAKGIGRTLARGRGLAARSREEADWPYARARMAKPPAGAASTGPRPRSTMFLNHS